MPKTAPKPPPHQTTSLANYLLGEPEQVINAGRPTRILITWLHADEELAPRTALHLYTTRPDLAAHVDYICGNPKAAAHPRRIGFTDTDLNRSFDVPDPTSYEEKRAVHILKLAKQYDYVLDLHTTVNPNFGSCIFVDAENLHKPAIRDILTATSNRRIIAMPKTKTHKSLIHTSDNAVAIEYSAADVEPNAVADTIKLIENLLGDSTHIPSERTIYYVEGTIPKSQDPGSEARNFQLWKPGGYYPILLSSGPRSYREDPTKDYCCFYAKKTKTLTL